MPELHPGIRLAERYILIRTLGVSENAITYLANDHRRSDQVTIKEFFPADATRTSAGVVKLGEDAHSRRRKILDDGKKSRALAVADAIGVREVFTENGTAYRVTEYLQTAQILETIKDTRQLLSLLAAIERIHDRGSLHLNLKRSNVLIIGERLVLVDALSPFAWERSLAMFGASVATPKPSADIYCLAQLLAGSGYPLPGSLDHVFDESPGKRPQSIRDFRQLILAQNSRRVFTAKELDLRLHQAKSMRSSRRECPACFGVLDRPTILSDRACPICREGTIRQRELTQHLCPCCQTSKLQIIDNLDPLRICPICKFGELVYRRRSLIDRRQISACRDCFATFSSDGQTLTLETTDGANPEPMTVDAWRNASGRSEKVMHCHQCRALFDVLTDDRWQQVRPAPESDGATYYPDEWMSIAHGLSPASGNATCDHCSGEFDRTKTDITVLSAPTDPYGFARQFAQRALSLDQIRWLGAGKRSPKPGLVCEECGTEFDTIERGFELVDSPNVSLIRHTGEVYTIDDWHRISQDLPTSSEYDGLEADLIDRLSQSFRHGEIGFTESSPEWWRGKAVDDRGRTVYLVADDQEMQIGTLLRRQRIALKSILEIQLDSDVVSISTSESSKKVQILPIQLERRWSRQRWMLELNSLDFVERCRFEIDKAHSSE